MIRSTDTTQIREDLNNRRKNLAKRLEKIVAEVRHSNGLDSDFEEQAVQRENDEVLANMDDVVRAELKQIERTLNRLDAGRYGVCERCNQPIPPERLEAAPYAAYCLRCQDKTG